MKNYVLVALLIVLVISVMGVCFVSCAKEVYADELPDNAILNFNQVYKYSFGSQTYQGITYTRSDYQMIVNGTSTGSDYVYQNSNILISNHIYFYNIDNFSPFYNIRYRSKNSGTVYTSLDNSFIFVAESDLFQVAYSYNNGVTFNNVVIKPMLVDLTQMFGAGNEPTTVEEVKSYLPLDYYNYTLGTPVGMSTLESYNQGILDSLGSYDYTISSASLIKSSQPVNYNGVESSIAFLGDSTQTISFVNMISIPLGVTVNRGEHIIFETDIVLQTEGSLSIGYLSNGFFVPLTDEFDNGHVKVDFITAQDLSSIYLYVDSGASTFVFPTITLKVLNYERLNLLAYKSGQDSINVDKIKADSYQEGYNAGMVVDNPYTFRALITSVFDTPIRSLFGYKDTNIYLMDAYGRVVLDQEGNAVLNEDYGHRVGGVLNFYIPEFDLDLSSLGMALITIALFVIIIKFTLGR